MRSTSFAFSRSVSAATRAGSMAFSSSVMVMRATLPRPGGAVNPPSLKAARRTLPVAVRGSSVANSTIRGYLYGAVSALTWSCSSRASASEGAWPSRSTTTARTTLPRSASGAATTAASATAACAASTDSTSNGPIRYPAETITSSLRPSKYRKPSASARTRSPVRHCPAGGSSPR